MKKCKHGIKKMTYDKDFGHISINCLECNYEAILKERCRKDKDTCDNPKCVYCY